MQCKELVNRSGIKPFIMYSLSLNLAGIGYVGPCACKQARRQRLLLTTRGVETFDS